MKIRTIAPRNYSFAKKPIFFSTKTIELKHIKLHIKCLKKFHKSDLQRHLHLLTFKQGSFYKCLDRS